MASPLSKIGKDTLAYLPATFSPAIAGLLAIPIYTRLFNPEQFGHYAIATTTIAFLTAVFSGWIAQAAIRFYEASAHKEGNLIQYHSTILFSMIILIVSSGIGAILVLQLLKETLDKALYLPLLLGIFCFIVNSAYRVYLSVLRAARQSRLYSFMEIVNSFARIGFAVALIIILGFGVEGILLGFFISTAIVLALTLNKLKLRKQISLDKWSWASFREFFSFGFPLSLALISTWLMTLANRYLIGLLRDSEEVGLYSVSSQLSEKPLTLLFSSIMLAAYPIIVGVWEQKGKESAQLLINELSRYYLMLLLPVVVLISVFGQEIILVITTEKYAASHTAIPFIATGIFFYGLSQYLSKGFELQKKTSILAANMLTAGILNVILTIPFVIWFGFKGAAFSMMLAYIFLFWLIKSKSKAFLDWHIKKKSLLRIIGATLFMIIIATMLKSTVTASNGQMLLIAAISLVLYASVLLLSGEISLQEKNAIKKFFTSGRANT